MKIKLKKDPASNLDRTLVKHIARYMKNSKLVRNSSFASGTNGLVLSFRYELNDTYVEFTITKKSINFNNVVQKANKNWSNISLSVENNVKRITFEGHTFKSIPALYDYLFSKYCGRTPIDYRFQIKTEVESDEQTALLQMINDIANEPSLNLYTDMTYTFIDDSPQPEFMVCPCLFSDTLDTKVTFAPNGNVKVESSINKINTFIKGLNRDECSVYTNDTSMSYSDLFLKLQASAP